MTVWTGCNCRWPDLFAFEIIWIYQQSWNGKLATVVCIRPTRSQIQKPESSQRPSDNKSNKGHHHYQPLKAKTCELPKLQKNARDKVVFICSFASHWQRGWREFSGPINKTNAVLNYFFPSSSRLLFFSSFYQISSFISCGFRLCSEKSLKVYNFWSVLLTFKALTTPVNRQKVRPIDFLKYQ